MNRSGQFPASPRARRGLRARSPGVHDGAGAPRAKSVPAPREASAERPHPTREARARTSRAERAPAPHARSACLHLTRAARARTSRAQRVPAPHERSECLHLARRSRAPLSRARVAVELATRRRLVHSDASGRDGRPCVTFGPHRSARHAAQHRELAHVRQRICQWPLNQLLG